MLRVQDVVVICKEEIIDKEILIKMKPISKMNIGFIFEIGFIQGKMKVYF